VLSGRILDPNDLEKLTAIKESLENSGKMADQIDGSVHLKDYRQVQQRKPNFQPNAIDFIIGTIVYNEGMSQAQPAAVPEADQLTAVKHKSKGKERDAKPPFFWYVPEIWGY
jgi:pentose-5-phosphate-3-epimerase